MKHLSRVLIFCGLLLWAAPVRAQWSGSLELSGGLGATKADEEISDEALIHGLAQGAFRLNYRTDTFRWALTLNGKWEPKAAENFRVSFKTKDLSIAYKSTTARPLTAGIQSDFTWTPPPTRLRTGRRGR